MKSSGNFLIRSVRPTLLMGCAAVGLAGCATEKWVQEYVRQQNAPIESNVSRVDSRVSQVDARVTKVAGETTQARTVADDGVRKADAVNDRLAKALTNRHQRDMVESVPVRFDTGKVSLTQEHRATLDNIVQQLSKNPTYTADIIGFTDAQGVKKANYLLSLRREENVRRYLAQNGDMLHRIAFIGMGEDFADGPQRDAADRQVVIKIYRPKD